MAHPQPTFRGPAGPGRLGEAAGGKALVAAHGLLPDAERGGGNKADSTNWTGAASPVSSPPTPLSTSSLVARQETATAVAIARSHPTSAASGSNSATLAASASVLTALATAEAEAAAARSRATAAEAMAAEAVQTSTSALRASENGAVRGEVEAAAARLLAAEVARAAAEAAKAAAEDEVRKERTRGSLAIEEVMERAKLAAAEQTATLQEELARAEARYACTGTGDGPGLTIASTA